MRRANHGKCLTTESTGNTEKKREMGTTKDTKDTKEGEWVAK